MMKKLYFSLIFLTCVFTVEARQEYILENKNLSATINLDDGSLVGLNSKLTSWNILSNASYGQSFEANIKLKDGSFYMVNGRSQDKPTVKTGKDEVIFTWNGIRAGSAKLDIVFEGQIKITERGLVYSGRLDNRSDAIVEQLCWPYIGEITVPDENDRFWFQYMTYTRLNSVELYPSVPNPGWSNLPEHAFSLFHNKKQGLYLSEEDAKMEEYIRCVYETIPNTGFAAIAGAAGSKKENAERKQMHIQAKAARMLYLQPKSEATLMPVLATPYTGTWHKAADIYKEWRKTWYVEPHRPEWVRKVNAWQQLQINSSESRINFTIKDLPKYVDECKKYGVDAIQLTGWNRGGQDRGVPVHDLDPRLGTAAEFKKIIADADKKGVKILLFTKFTWIDLTTPWYSEYEPYIAWDYQGNQCIHPGYNYNTYPQLLGISTRRFGILCMMDAQLRAKLEGEFQKCLDLGAPGMVYDENQHHAGTYLCFNPNHGHKIPGFVYQGAGFLGKEFLEMCKKSNPEFLMVGEGCYDLQSPYYSTYTRANFGHEPALRYIDNEMPIACAVMDHFDKNKINMCLADRYIISYEPRSFKGHLYEFPRMMAYGTKVDDLRKKYSDYLWDAEFLDTQGATITGNKILFTVFVSKKTGKKAVVVYNTDVETENKATVVIDGSGNPQVMVSPENPDPVAFNGSVTIGPQSVVVIIEN